MITNTVQWVLLPATVLTAALVGVVDGFAPISPRGHVPSSGSITHHPHDVASALPVPSTSHADIVHRTRHLARHRTRHQTRQYMSSNDNNDGPGAVTAVFISAVLLFFVVSAFAPLLDFMATSPTATDLSLGDAVVTRQDEAKKLQSYQSKFDALSPVRVQEKLGNLPVFYVSLAEGSDSGSLGDKIYLSYTEAESAAKSSGGTVKTTTLDQVLYPLIVKKGTTKVSGKTPAEIKAARESATASYSLVPSKAALNDAKDITLKQGDIPLFVVERLAFAGDDGRPQVPLFTEKGDAVTSYARLRESGGNRLPEEPSIRTTSLLDVLESMERGTRPGVGQLVFYGNADDVLKADEMASR